MKAWLGAAALSAMACAGQAATVNVTLETGPLSCRSLGEEPDKACSAHLSIAYEFDGTASAVKFTGRSEIRDGAGAALIAAPVYWQAEDVDEDGNEFCVTLCAEATTNGDGTLAFLKWTRFGDFMLTAEGDLSGAYLYFGLDDGAAYDLQATWQTATYTGLPSPAPVPLPASLGLLAAAAGALGLAGVRRSARAA